MFTKRKQDRTSAFAGFCLAAVLATTGFAQSVEKIGIVRDFQSASVSKGNTKSLKKTAFKLAKDEMIVNSSMLVGNDKQFIGGFSGDNSASVVLNVNASEVSGFSVSPKQEKAFRYYTDKNGNVFKKSEDIHSLMCIDYSKGQTAPSLLNQSIAPAGSPAYTLQSLPGAEAVAYLDFDGEYVAGTFWNAGNPINAAPYSIDANGITEIWKLVSEDFRVFKLNITTDSMVYKNAAPGKRMKVIFTPTTTASPGSGGVAYISSFTWTNYTPCWVFNGGIKAGGETASHEIGHTLGLLHDGRSLPNGTNEGYFFGHGDWAPIMGASFNASVAHWSKGEYQYANNLQDDLHIISTQNGFSKRNDDHSDNDALATPINFVQYSLTSIPGIIENESDVDRFAFTVPSAGKKIKVSATAFESYANLDIYMAIYDADGVRWYESNPTNSMSASLYVDLPQGNYFVAVSAASYGSPATNGYSTYSSIGSYTLHAELLNNQAPIISIASPTAGNVSANTPLLFWVNVYDPDGNDPSISDIRWVKFYDNGTLIFTDYEGAYYQFPNMVLSPGQHVLKATTQDIGGAINEAVVIVNAVLPSDISGPACISSSPNVFSLNAANRVNATGNNWWVNTGTAYISATNQAQFEVTVLPSYPGAQINGQVCVGVNYNQAPWYKQYCKTITSCGTRMVSSEEVAISTGLSISPNPSRENFTIRSDKNILELKVVNAQGKEMYALSAMEKASTIALGATLPAGIYQILIRYEDGTDESQKLVKVE